MAAILYLGLSELIKEATGFNVLWKSSNPTRWINVLRFALTETGKVEFFAIGT